MPDKLPPRAEGSVLAVTASSDINAPPDKVWEVLLDFPSYPEWNAFVRTQTVVDKSGHPHASQLISEGSLLHLTVHLPPTMEHKERPSSTSLLVTLLDHSTHRVAWESQTLPAWLLRTERWQWLTVLDSGKTRYETIEVFNGPLAWIIKWFVSANLRLGFQAMADGVKERTEGIVPS
ncbi:hypothetical protein PHLGIDRAFT_20508 [Phlebiopsis gigantea 11061_1 CR5-6]|uniref:Coenzyme Q-binding protein COQ10 START domain-containing protein n=1 Tax=Phlebiopsis gigantea (strain 11061_1 CR5-6) TaxID=745531 RepID=A0A0C3S329_PHLG1|nr:hypothetical protein PHLGIDRAFT_20508 [Phlebiopsis gigantea 11061_1 CR5-6]